MDIATTSAEDPLLEYVFSTDPDPIYASAAEGEPARCDLRLTATNFGREPVYCTQLTLRLPVGPRAAQLALSGAGITGLTAPAIWSVAAPQEDVLIVVPQDGTALFPASEHGTAETPTPSLVVLLKGIRINRAIGTAHLELDESAATAVDGPWSTRTAVFPVTKIDPLSPADALAQPGTEPSEEAGP